MKMDLSNINELCLPYMKRPKKIIGAKVVVLDDISNRAGQVIKKGEIAEVWQSFRGYGIKIVDENGQRISITRVSHYDVRFLRP